MMKLDDITLLIFEVVPLERLQITSADDAFRQFVSALEGIGYKLKDTSHQSLLFEVSKKDELSLIAYSEFGDGEQYRYGYTWLATEYYKWLLLLKSQYDILFALASDRDVEEKDPYDIPAHYLSSEVGGLVYPPTIPRILLAAALWKQGEKELGDQVNCKTNFPDETALAGDIRFYEPPLKYNLRIQDAALGYEFVPLTVLDTALLTSHQMVSLLQSESLLDSVELARAMPYQLVFSDIEDKDTKEIQKLYWWNHFSIRARQGTVKSVLRELLTISLHLNWFRPSSPKDDSPFTSEHAFQFALAQRNRLNRLENEEQRLQHGLEILQRRYPNRTELLEWQVNNIYTNVVRYSPVYLTWKAHLESYLQKGTPWQIWIASRLGELDWSYLATIGIVGLQDAKRLIDLANIDPASALTRMRVIIEKITQLVYKATFAGRQPTTLASMINELNEKKVFPPIIHVCLNALRQAGNIGAHETSAKLDDVMAVIPLFIRIVEWFVDWETRRK